VKEVKVMAAELPATWQSNYAVDCRNNRH